MRLVLCALAFAFACNTVRALRLPTGALLTPAAARGAALVAVDHPIATAASPDGKTLLVLTSGYKSAKDPREHVVVFAVTAGALVEQQRLEMDNAFQGMSWSPDGLGFFVSGGVDDRVLSFARGPAGYSLSGAPISLGHAHGLGIQVKPMTAGLAADSTRVLVANYENDSISVIELATRKVTAELDLRPACEFPMAVALVHQKAYVSCQRTSALAVIDLSTNTVARTIRVGRQPGRMVVSELSSRLYVANGGSDSVSIIDTKADTVLGEVATVAPDTDVSALGGLKGANPNALALSADEKTLYVSNGGTNSVAVIDLAAGDVRALLPTGWYPHTLSIIDGTLVVGYGKSLAGPNQGGCRNHVEAAPCLKNDQYVLRLVRGGLLSLPLPDAREEQRLTAQVAGNNHFGEARDDELMSALQGKIKHVVYIVKENRSYDQVLGDLPGANGDPRLTLFPEPITPNHHALAHSFVTLDAFFDSGQVSGDGWNWSTAGRTSDVTEKSIPVLYGGRGLSYDYEGSNRNINVGLTGGEDVASPGNYLWDAALAKGVSVRNYGFFADDSLYERNSPGYLPTSHAAFADKKVQFVPTKPALRAISDPWFRSFDQTFADYWNYKEWEREFDEYARTDTLPALELVRFAHDHFGSFKAAEDGVNTPETQMADNDYALGLLLEKIARSRYAADTVVFVVEDDAQDGPDHVDAQRSIALVAGAYVKQGAVISRPFTTVSVLRTIEALLGLSPLGLTDGLAAPMSDVFARDYRPWTYAARVPRVLRSTRLPLPPGPSAQPRHDAAFWEAATAGQDFSHADAADAQVLNDALWRGLR